jgi:integrase
MKATVKEQGRASGASKCFVQIRGKLATGELVRERYTRDFESVKHARIWAQARIEQLIRGEVKPNTADVPTLEKFFDRWIDEYATANRHKPSGIAHKRVMFKAHLQKLHQKRLHEITAADVAQIKAAHAQAGKSTKTTNNALVVLSRMLRVAIEWGLIDEAPAIRLLKVEKKARPFYDVERYERLIAGATNATARAAILLAGDAGLRRGELLGLEWQDVDLVRRVLIVRRSQVQGITGSTKGNAARHVPMTEVLHAALEALPARSGRVLGKKSPKQLRTLVEQAEDAAGLPKTGLLHVLRHTYASHLAAAGESLYRIQQAMGHQDHATTQLYSHLSPDSLRPLAEAINRRRIGQNTGTIE